MLLSGSVGFTLLFHEKSGKYVLVLADIHDGVEYCSTYLNELDITKLIKNLTVSNLTNESGFSRLEKIYQLTGLKMSIGIADLLEELSHKYNILLEETLKQEKTKLTDLWPGSHHTQQLKHLNINNDNIRPVDIRPLLIPFSWEILDTPIINYKYSTMTLKTYLEKIIDLFNLKETPLVSTYIRPEIKKLQDGMKFKYSLLSHFYELRKLFAKFLITYEAFLNIELGDIFKKDLIILNEINYIISCIMEWYTIVLIHNSSLNTVIHLGLAHTDNIIKLLTSVYQFKIITQSGLNQMLDITEDAKSCVYVPPKVKDVFN
jgi:hypothetical protein